MEELELSILRSLIDEEPPAKRVNPMCSVKPAGSVKRVKRSHQSKKIAHNVAQRRHTARINELILEIRERIGCDHKDKISILEAVLKKVSA